MESSPRGAHGFENLQLQTLLAQIFDQLGQVRIALSGGEPLARARDALNLLRSANGRHPLLLLTNGTLITRAIATQLTALDLTIRISLDGFDAASHDFIRGHGAFKRTLRGIEVLREEGFPFERLELFVMLPPEHIHVLREVVELAKDLGISRLKIEPIAKTGRATEYWNGYSKEVDPDTLEYRNLLDAGIPPIWLREWCIQKINDTAFDVLNIYSDGAVYPYTFQDEDDRSVGFLGNVLNEPLSDILNEERLSSAIIDKFLRQARGPARSLAAFRLTRTA